MKDLMLGELSARCTKKQKLAFYEHMKNMYGCKTEKIRSSKNILLGDIYEKDYIVCAHYDTAKRNVINTKMYYDKARRNNFKRGFFGLVNFFAAHKPNINNFNDNTSGILCALDIYSDKKIGCVLFDNEESGYSGSSAIQKKHKELRDKFFINIDTIGIGNDFVIIYNKDCLELAKKLAEHFDGEIDLQKANQSRYMTDSDFLKKAVTVTCLKKDKNGLRYIDDIHSKHDNKINLHNIEKVKNMICGFLSSPDI